MILLISDSRAVELELKTKEHFQRPITWFYVDFHAVTYGIKCDFAR